MSANILKSHDDDRPPRQASNGHEAFAIWWIRGQDMWTMQTQENDAPEDLPKYIRRELESMCGRNGRGRLWGSQDIETALPWPFTKAAAYAMGAGGIIIKRKDVEKVKKYKGVVTDFNMECMHFNSDQMEKIDWNSVVQS